MTSHRPQGEGRRPITVLVLAAQRDGVIDPLAARFGVSHKCLVPLCDQPLIAHVLLAVAAAPQMQRILVSIDDPAVLDGVDVVQRLMAQGRLRIVQAQPSLADSVLHAADAADFPLLITTADNALFTPEAITTMQDSMDAHAAAIGAAFARKDAVLTAHPEGQRRFYRFADDSYSNCNCYWIGGREALAAANIFREGGQFAKHPARLARSFGIVNLILFRLGIGTLQQSFARFSRRLRLRLEPVVFQDGALAIDVDNDRTYAIVEDILKLRKLRRCNPQISAISNIAA
ncbi:NTP transferase domain-containing protein [Sphingobium algorifonticola]|uniref:Spore coat biosynthesis protein F n=1 Tax=Sphingobium algorifonticola TaxID=2008318 RepID=A0A437JCV6_9SPHN|nr:NTP transferase domain-containing protein [Sphingobium algorifonticola]RVT43749.1 spore coat biosynthesis protein F [Sphingobium algorifonticola]